MFEQAAGLALLAAISPPAVLIAAMYLSSPSPGKTTALFVVGGLAVVAVIGTIALIALRAGGVSLPSHHQTRYGLRLGLGVIAVIAAVLIYRRRPAPKKSEDPADSQNGPESTASKQKKPGLIARWSSEPSPRTAFAVGIFMFGPSISFVAAVQVVASSKADLTATVGAMVMIIVLTVAFAWLPLVAYLLAPARTTRAWQAFDGWLRRNRRTVLAGAVGVIGVLLVAQGIAGVT
ncbi:MAG: GAP family protein [Nocardiopsaceae bacterium]|nr:GAP family protein [Nocardiopsaceae bacterium]